MKPKSLAIPLLFLLGLALLLPGCAKKRRERLLFYTESSFPPYEFMDGDRIVGIDVSIAKEIAKAVDRDLVIVHCSFDHLLDSLVEGKADMAIASISVTPERQEIVDFSIPYTSAGMVIVRRKDDASVASPESLVGKRVGAQGGTTAESYVRNELHQAPVLFDIPAQFMVAVEAGDLDAAICDNEPATTLVSSHPNLEILPDAITRDDYAVAVRKGDADLLDAVNSVLARILADGTYQAFCDEAAARYEILDTAFRDAEQAEKEIDALAPLPAVLADLDATLPREPSPPRRAPARQECHR